MNNASEFSNPDKLPIENLTITGVYNGIFRTTKALNPYWIEERKLVTYERPPTGSDLVFGALDAWTKKMEEYAENLKWLLAMEHHRFWSTIMYHPQCMDVLVSFLQEANPPYMEDHESSSVQTLYEAIRKLVLVVFCRLITNKESITQWMTKEFMAELIYNNFIFTLPILWDLCLVYGVDNGQHIARIVNSVFTLQPNYLVDLSAAIVFVKDVFKYIIVQVNKNYDNPEPPNLPEMFSGFKEPRRPPTPERECDRLTFPALKDLVLHLLDTVLTLRIFIESYPACVHIFHKHSIVISIAQLYEYGIPYLYEKLDECGDDTSASYTEVQGHIDTARAETIDMYREILAMYKSVILSGEGDTEAHVEQYLAVMMEGLSEKLLMRDYHSCYPVHDDLEMLRQVCPDIDTVKTDFILQAIYSNLEEPIPERLLHNKPETSAKDQLESIDNAMAGTSKDDIPDQIREESLISEVRDILPHLGDGFILKCLQHYDFDAEKVINSVLEDNLAESLRSVDRLLPLIPEDILDKKFLETGVERLNVFDGDQFDIMTRDDVDVSKIHVGKRKSKYKDMKDMLNDKSDVKQRLDIYNNYTLVYDEEAMYSDEYDDTYDEGGAGAAGDAAADDERRPLVTPRVLRKAHAKPGHEEESSEDSDNEEKSDSGRNRMDFCVNPEEVRARREANFRMKNQRPGRAPPARDADVTGKPKGQGQEKEVLKSRDSKEKHKSSRGNHNRRQGAQWKRSRGMLPS